MGRFDALLGGNEKQLFVYFQQLGECIDQAGAQFMMLANDFSNAKTHADALHKIEHDADEVAASLFHFLNAHTSLPFDHEDIEKLIVHGDDVIDLLWGAANRIANIYELTDPDPELLEMAGILISMTQEIKNLFAKLKKRKYAKNLTDVIKRFHAEENRADELRGDIVRRRYQLANKDFRLEPLRNAWGEVIQRLEHATDKCVDITDVLGNLNRKY